MSAFIDWIVQGSLLAAAVAAIVAGASLSAAARHRVWGASLAVILALPALGWLSSRPAPPEAAAPAVAHPMLVVETSVAAVELALIALWMVAACSLLARLARDIRRAAVLRRDALPFPAAREARLTMWTTRPTTGRPIDLRLSTAVDVPCAIGLGRATILVPVDALGALDDRALDQVVMHEHAHLVRRDDWWQLAETLARAIAVVHPAVHWLGRRLALDREHACDDAVVAQMGDATGYARCLVDVAQLSLDRRHVSLPAVVPGATRAGRVLRARVLRLISGPARPAFSRARAMRVVAASALALGAIATSLVVPAVSFREALGQFPDVVRRLPVVFSPQTAMVTVAVTPDGLARPPAITPRARPAILPASRDMTGRLSPLDQHVDDQPLAEGRPLVPDDAPVVHDEVLASRTFVPGVALSESGTGLSASPVEQQGAGNPWRRLADAGMSLGDGAAAGGRRIGRFFVGGGDRVADKVGGSR